MTASPLAPLYRLMELLSGIALIGMGAVVFADVLLREAGRMVPGAADFSGYGLVAVFFLGLAPAYRRGDHVRVGLVIDRLTGRIRIRLEIVLLAFATAGVAWAAVWCGRFAWDSWRFGDVAQGVVAVPLWIPQLAMPIGLAVFALALVEDLVVALRGGVPTSIGNAHAPSDDPPTFDR